MLAKWKSVLPAVFVTIAVAIPVIPLIGQNNYYLSIMVMTGIWIILVSSLNLVVGCAGQVSICQAAFFGIGAYTSALLALKAGWPFWIALPTAGIVSGIFGLLIGMPSTRLSGHYLAIATLAFGAIVTAIFERWDALTYPPGEGAIVRCIPRPEPIPLLSLDFRNLAHYYYLVLIVVLLTIWTVHRLVNSRFGRALVAIREDEILAKSVGIATARYKTQAFAISALFAGLAGSLYAHYSHSITPGTFVFLESFYMVVAVIIGGVGSTSGAIVGTIFLRVIREILRVRVPQPWIPDFITLVFGAILIAVIMFSPSGLVRFGQNVKGYWAARRIGRPLWASGFKKAATTVSQRFSGSNLDRAR
jgi:branched-chain amino acid transport system permease protein